VTDARGHIHPTVPFGGRTGCPAIRTAIGIASGQTGLHEQK
jgi:hypothetical protein